MKRRTFLTGVAGTTLAASTLPKPAIAQGKRTLKLVTTWPRNFPGLGTSAQRLANQITLATDGELTVKLFAAGEMVPAFDSFDAVSSGKADLYHAADYYWVKKSKGFTFFCAVPFGMLAHELDAWLQYMGGQKLWDELSANYRIKPFSVGSTGVQMGGWFNREINSIEDLRGLKMRIPGLGGEVLRRLGVKTINLPGGKIVDALKSGKIDATEWVGPWSDLALGVHKVAKYYYWPGFHEPGTTISAGINLDVWESLTLSQRNIITMICGSEGKNMLAEFNAKNGDALDKLISNHGVKLRRTSFEILKKLGVVSGQVVEETAADDPTVKKIYNSFIDSRQKLLRWAKYSDEAYLVARRLPFPYGSRGKRFLRPTSSPKASARSSGAQGGTSSQGAGRVRTTPSSARRARKIKQQTNQNGN